MPGRKIDSPNCSTCRHFRPEPAPLAGYPHCVLLNVREGWRDLTFMPTEPEHGCFRHEDREPA